MKKDLRKRAAENVVEGTAKQISGRVRNAAGALTGKPSEQIKGKAKEIEGKAQKALGDVQDRAARRTSRKPANLEDESI